MHSQKFRGGEAMEDKRVVQAGAGKEEKKQGSALTAEAMEGMENAALPESTPNVSRRKV